MVIEGIGKRKAATEFLLDGFHEECLNPLAYSMKTIIPDNQPDGKPENPETPLFEYSEGDEAKAEWERIIQRITGHMMSEEGEQ